MSNRRTEETIIRRYWEQGGRFPLKEQAESEAADAVRTVSFVVGLVALAFLLFYVFAATPALPN